MPIVDPTNSRSDNDAFSRRTFMTTGLSTFFALDLALAGLGSALAPTTSLAQDHATREKEQLNSAQRIALLGEIGSVIDNQGPPEVRIEQMGQVTSMVDRYRAALNTAEDITVAELVEATSVVRVKINMTHYSADIDPALAGPFINRNALEFYRDLHTRLMSLKDPSPEEMKEAHGALRMIRGDIYWSAAHKMPAISEHCGRLVSDIYIEPEKCSCISQVQSCMHFNPEQYQFHLAVLKQCQDQLPCIFSATIDNILQGKEADPSERAIDLIKFSTLIRRVVSIAREGETLSPSDSVLWNEKISCQFERPLFNKLVPIYIATLKEKKPLALTDQTSYVSLDLLRPFLREQTSLVSSMGKFINGLAMSKVELGNQFMESYRAEGVKNGLTHLRRVELAPLLMYLAPEPSLKEPIVRDIRTLLRADPAAQNQPEVIASLLGVLLLSDQVYAASKLNKNLEIGAAATTTCGLMQNSEETALSANTITPAQALLVDLTRAGINVDGWRFIAPSGELDEKQRTILAELAEASVRCLALDIYQLTPRSVYLEKPDGETVAVSVPERWGPEAVILEEGRNAELHWSLQNFARLADGITANYARFDSEHQTAESLIERMLLISRLLEERESTSGLGGSREAIPVLQVRESFPYISEKANGGPFVDVFSKTRNMLYLARHGRNAPLALGDSGGRSQKLKDEELDNLARDLATSMEQHFICSYAITLWHSDEEKELRPLESHQSLAPSRMAGEVQRMLYLFGLYEKYDAIPPLFDGKGTGTLDKIRRYRDTLSERQEVLLDKISAIVEPPKR